MLENAPFPPNDILQSRSKKLNSLVSVHFSRVLHMLPSRMIDTPTCPDIEREFREYPNEIFICYLWATWCVPCKRIGPVVDEMVKSHAKDAVFLKVNADGCVDFLRKHTLKSIPVLIAPKRGREINRLYRELPKTEIIHFIEESIKAGMRSPRFLDSNCTLRFLYVF